MASFGAVAIVLSSRFTIFVTNPDAPKNFW
jgi:hypothetical protein